MIVCQKKNIDLNQFIITKKTYTALHQERKWQSEANHISMTIKSRLNTQKQVIGVSVFVLYVIHI